MRAEEQEQVAVAQFIRYRYPDILWTASTGGMRTSIGTAKKMKLCGYIAGCPDIMIFEPRKGFYGLFIELKKRYIKGESHGVVSPEQKKWLGALDARGYTAHVCYGSEEAMNVIDDYLSERVKYTFVPGINASIIAPPNISE